MAHGAAHLMAMGMEETGTRVQWLTCCVQQLAIGVLSTMFGGIFLLGGGSSKAVQQSPPIKASSRGEEDFIQYVPNTTGAITLKKRMTKDKI